MVVCTRAHSGDDCVDRLRSTLPQGSRDRRRGANEGDDAAQEEVEQEARLMLLESGGLDRRLGSSQIANLASTSTPEVLFSRRMLSVHC